MNRQKSDFSNQESGYFFFQLFMTFSKTFSSLFPNLTSMVGSHFQCSWEFLGMLGSQGIPLRSYFGFGGDFF